MLKVGDKVKITDSIDGHEFKIGKIVTITRIDGIDDYRAEGKNDYWWIGEEECELIKEETKMLNTVITHKITTVDEKGCIKQQMNLTHQEYISLVDQLTENIEIQEENEDYDSYLENLIFGRVNINEQ